MLQVVQTYTVGLAHKKQDWGVVLEEGKYTQVNELVRDAMRFYFFEITRIPRIQSWRLVLTQVMAQEPVSDDKLRSYAAKLGLVSTYPSDGLLLGRDIVGRELTLPFVFLHEPSYGWGDQLFQLVLERDGQGKKVTFKVTGGYWSPHNYFVFREG